MRWTLRVAADGVVSTSRTVPYSDQCYFSTEARANHPDKSSEYRLSVEEVLNRHAALCSKRGMAVSVEELRGRVLDRDDVATNNGGEIDLLANGGRD